MTVINNMTEQQGFFTKYKKWIIAGASLYLIPSILAMSLIIGAIAYNILSNDTNFNPVKQHIMAGLKVGHADYEKISGQLKTNLWEEYRRETNLIEGQVETEREEYLAQFSESERTDRLAEMRLNNIKLPSEAKLKKRFRRGIDFYADYVKQKVKRENYKSDEEYNEALADEAWKVGYTHGFYEGGFSYDRARDSLTITRR
jgi:hypothetical protein